MSFMSELKDLLKKYNIDTEEVTTEETTTEEAEETVSEVVEDLPADSNTIVVEEVTETRTITVDNETGDRVVEEKRIMVDKAGEYYYV